MMLSEDAEMGGSGMVVEVRDEHQAIVAEGLFF